MFKTSKPAQGSRQFEVYSHRGLALNYPENTIEAFEAAVSYGAKWIETDVNCTKDGVIVVFHDPTLNRVAGVSGTISQMTWAEIQAVSLPGGYRIPSLEEALTRFPKTNFNIDVKDSGSAQNIGQVVARSGAINRIRIASFSDSRRANAVRNIRRAVPGRAIQTSGSEIGLFLFYLLMRTVPMLWPTLEKKLSNSLEPFDSIQVPRRYSMWGIKAEVVTPRLIAVAHRLGKKVQVWTVDEPSEMRELIDMGVDGIVTNRVDLLAELLGL